MISKQKLLQWIEEKKYVYKHDPGTMPDEDWHYCDGAMKILGMIERAADLGYFDAEEEEPGPRFNMDANGNLTLVDNGE